MRLKLLWGLLFAFFSASTCWAQQYPSFSNYLNSIVLYNPAYAGATGFITANCFYRNQWNQISGAPATIGISLHSPVLHKSIGIGGLFMKDQQGPLSVFTAAMMYAYKINFKNGVLSLGLNGGLKQFKINSSFLDPKDLGDNKLSNSEVNWISPDFGTGIFFQSKSLQISISALQLLNVKKPYGLKLSPELFFIGSYIINHEAYIQIKPAIFVKKNIKGASQGEMSLYANSPEAGLGISYRTNKIVSFQIIFNLLKLMPALQENISIGYAYDHFVGSSALGNGANEFFLQYSFKIHSTLKQIGKQPKSYAPKFF